MPVMIIISCIPYYATSVLALMPFDWADPVSTVMHYVFCTIDPPYLLFGGLFYIWRVGFLVVPHTHSREALLGHPSAARRSPVNCPSSPHAEPEHALCRWCARRRPVALF